MTMRPGTWLFERSGTKFDPDKTYSVVVNDFLAAGLEKLGLVASTDKKGVAEDEPLIQNLLADYIRTRRSSLTNCSTS